MPLADGQTFAGYRILRFLGSGGMGQVYLVQHPRLPRKEALKVLAAEVSVNAEYRARFNLEADLASELYHPHIVGVHDRGADDGQLWISMDYVDGLDTARLLADKYRHGMPAHQVTKIVAAVASALDYAHDRELLHRDVKPANIMLTNDKSEQRILLADFGIARSLNAISSLTATGYTVGTVAYAAPEQLMGQEIDGRTDQYSLAATAYHLLTGSQLFPHSLVERPVGHAALNSVLATALAKKPDDRFPKCVDFARALTLAQIDGRTGTASKRPVQATTQPGARAKRATATRPTTSVPPATTPDDSVYIPHDAGDAGGRGARWPITAGIVIVLLLLAVAFFVRPWQDQDRSASGNSRTPTSVAPTITFDGMRDFVEGYYADLPARPNDAWTKLDAHCQQQTGLSDYLDFWATIQSVTVISISPRDDTSVVAQLKYLRRDGHTNTEDRWFKMALVNGAMLLDESDRTDSASTTEAPTTPPVATFPASAIDNVMRSPTDLNNLLGTFATSATRGQVGIMKIDSSSYGMSDHSAQVEPPSCAGVVYGAEHQVYADTGFQEMRDQTFSPEAYVYNPTTTAPSMVEQTAVVFPSAEQAQAVLTSSEKQWRVCMNGKVGQRTGQESGSSFILSSVEHKGDLLTVSMASNGGMDGAYACQQALGVRENVVVGTRSCHVPASVTNPNIRADPGWASNDAERLAKAMLDKVKT